MPQVDLETLVCGGDRKIAACGGLIDDPHSPPDKPDPPPEAPPPDFPAESFQLSKEDEIDNWFDRNAAIYERKESQKGNSNPNHHNLNSSNSSSQRFSSSLNFKSNPSIIGLPKPQMKSSFLGSKSRRSGRPRRAPIFPKRPSRSGKSLTVTEPSSPKVSCIGRVRSKKHKIRRCASGRRPTTTTTEATTTTAKISNNSKPKKKTGFWANLMANLRSSCRDGSSVDIEEPPPPKDSPRWSFAERERKNIPASAPLGEPTGLDGMKRFASGRRSESWAVSALDFEDSSAVVVVDSDAPDDHHLHSIWRRRAVDPPKKIDCVRDWAGEGPSSV